MGEPAPTASPLVHRYRLEEFHALAPPRGGGHWEPIAGVLYMVPAPTRPHDLVVSRLNMIFAAYLLALPERGTLLVPRAAVWIPADTWLEPDLFLVSPERVRQGDMSSADLVVEVSSTSTAVYDRTAKADTYAALGVRALWLLDMERRTIERRVLGGSITVDHDDEPCTSLVFPGLQATPRQVFGD